MSTRVVHCKREPFDVYIGRPSKWGNPFKIGPRFTRQESIEAYRLHVAQQPDFQDQIRSELRGKVLGCWCAPQPCHGDVLVEFVDLEIVTRPSARREE